MFHLLTLLERQIRSLDHRPRPTLLFPEGDDPRIISAASALTGVANVVLFTTREQAEAAVESGAADLQGSPRRFFQSVRFADASEDEELYTRCLEAFWELSHGKRWKVPYERAQELLREPVMLSCMAVRLGYADAVLGGVAHASRDFFRPALRLLHTNRRAFEVALFSLPDSHPENIYQQNLVAFADVAINPDPDPETLAQIAVGACKIVRDLVPADILPQVNGAILSYSTRGSAEGPSVGRVREAALVIPELLGRLAEANPLYESIRIEPELQISCAISIAAAKSKLHDALADPGSPVGRANVLIVPSLDAGNLLYHLYATRYPDAERVLMVGNMKGRVLDFSRSASVQDVVLGGMATVLRLRRRAKWTGTPDDHFFPRYRTLVINPGSTTTKLSAYAGHREIFDVEVRHDAEQLRGCATVFDQLGLRQGVVEAALREHGLDPASLDAVVGRGGLIRPIPSGTYGVDEEMLRDLESARFGEHASNLGPALAHRLASSNGIPAFTVDPVVVDELDPVARVAGLAGYERRAVWHALSQKAVARRYAERLLRDYEDLNVIVAHMGGGVTVGCHRKGCCTFVTDGLDEGPMTAERTGSLPHSVLLDLVFEKGLDKRELRRLLCGQGGMLSHLGTTDLREVERRLEDGDERAQVVWEALAQGIAGTIAAAAVRFDGESVEQILLTGGMARSERLVARLRTLLRLLTVGITVFPGELENEALRDGALRVLRGQEESRDYVTAADRVAQSRAAGAPPCSTT